VQIVNGAGRFSGYGHVRDAEKIYKEGRAEVAAALEEPSEFELKLECGLSNGNIEGQLTVEGPDSESAIVQIILVERGVLYPGKSKIVIQRMVARGSLTRGLIGESYAPVNGRMTLAFSRSLDEITRENVAYLKEIESNGAGTVQTFAAKMDPRQLSVVGVVRNRSNEVLQAIHADASAPETEP
jgi:hypothetical protein